MLLNDRFVGSFGSVAAGDDELIVKVAVAAVRNGFAVVPMQFNSSEPACALTAAAAKKEPDHECYHVLTEDTKVRATFQRLTKAKAGSDEKPRIGLAIDIGASNIAVTEEVESWWEGPEISATLIMPDGRGVYVFDLSNSTEEDYSRLPDNVVNEGTLLVPPSQFDGKPVILIGQMNYLSDNHELFDNEEEETVTGEQARELWETRPMENNEMSSRIEELEQTVADQGQALDDLRATAAKFQEALVVALTTVKELRDAERSN
jgi:hypothetical protein